MVLERTLYMPQQLLTVEEVAERLQVSVYAQLRQWIREGKLYGFKVGKEWRVDPAELDKFIQKSARSATQERLNKTARLSLAWNKPGETSV